MRNLRPTDSHPWPVVLVFALWGVIVLVLLVAMCSPASADVGTTTRGITSEDLRKTIAHMRELAVAQGKELDAARDRVADLSANLVEATSAKDYLANRLDAATVEIDRARDETKRLNDRVAVLTSYGENMKARAEMADTEREKAIARYRSLKGTAATAAAVALGIVGLTLPIPGRYRILGAFILGGLGAAAAWFTL